MSDEQTYPEHEKLKAVREDSLVIGDFLEWLQGNLRFVAEYPKDEGAPYPDFPVRVSDTIEDLLAQYFEIDRIVLEREKQAMLATFRGE